MPDVAPSLAARSRAHRDQTRAYATMIRDRGGELAAAVASVAEKPGHGVVLDGPGDDRSRLIIALTLLAAGLPVDIVAIPDAALRDALGVLDEFNGPEFYLLQHGLAVEQFHILRERLRDGSSGNAA